MVFYVYVFLREDRYTPYYVGKGKDYRCTERTGRLIKPPRDKSRIVKIKENLTEEDAFELERTLIKFWGRKDLGTGVLLNRTDGGEGPAGKVLSEETKNKIRGYRHTEEAKEKMRDRVYDEEYRERCRQRRLGTTLSEETKKKISISSTGRRHTEETKLKCSLTNKGRKHGEEFREKCRERQTGKKWWNNGTDNKLQKECPGEGWVKGRLKWMNK